MEKDLDSLKWNTDERVYLYPFFMYMLHKAQAPSSSF